MGLFQKKPQTSNNAPLYTLGLQKTLAVVGLGNVGKEYEKTRHNVGFECLDAFAKEQAFTSWAQKKDLKCEVSTGNMGLTRVLLIKPTTLMNNSGQAVQAVLRFYKLAAADLLVVHDELDIEFGQIRCRLGGQDAGHNGIKSLIEHVGSNFYRIRVGIANQQAAQQDSAQFVLKTFDKNELSHLPMLTREVSALIAEFTANHELPHDTRTFIV